MNALAASAQILFSVTAVGQEMRLLSDGEYHSGP